MFGLYVLSIFVHQTVWLVVMQIFTIRSTFGRIWKKKYFLPWIDMYIEPASRTGTKKTFFFLTSTVKRIIIQQSRLQSDCVKWKWCVITDIYIYLLYNKRTIIILVGNTHSGIFIRLIAIHQSYRSSGYEYIRIRINDIQKIDHSVNVYRQIHTKVSGRYFVTFVYLCVFNQLWTFQTEEQMRMQRDLSLALIYVCMQKYAANYTIRLIYLLF